MTALTLLLSAVYGPYAAGLASPDYRTRERCTAFLAASWPLCEPVLPDSTDAEVRLRVERVRTCGTKHRPAYVAGVKLAHRFFARHWTAAELVILAATIEAHEQNGIPYPSPAANRLERYGAFRTALATLCQQWAASPECYTCDRYAWQSMMTVLRCEWRGMGGHTAYYQRTTDQDRELWAVKKRQGHR